MSIQTEPKTGPLAGIRVLEMATYVAAPFCATMLGEFGAEVIKLEIPELGDPARRYGTESTAKDRSLLFLSEGRNKKSITVDLRTVEGAALVKRLVQEVDVVIENFQPGTLESWGLGWTDLQAVNPRLVMARITGYGQTGPLRDRPGFGRIAIAFGGLGYITGYPDRVPTSPGTSTLADYLAGVFAANGVLLALRARDEQGIGQFIDLGLYEPVFRILDEAAPLFASTGEVRQRSGPSSHNSVPHSNFPTRDGRWVSIACTNDKIFSRLAQAMNRPELTQPNKWKTYKARRADTQKVEALVTEWTRSLDSEDVIKICHEYQVPCGPIYGMDEIFEDEQYASRGNILTFHDSEVGDLHIPNVIPRLSATPGSVRTLGPKLGEHNSEVFGDLLKIDREELDSLVAKHII